MENIIQLRKMYNYDVRRVQDIVFKHISTLGLKAYRETHSTEYQRQIKTWAWEITGPILNLHQTMTNIRKKEMIAATLENLSLARDNPNLTEIQREFADTVLTEVEIYYFRFTYNKY